MRTYSAPSGPPGWLPGGQQAECQESADKLWGIYSDKLISVSRSDEGAKVVVVQTQAVISEVMGVKRGAVTEVGDHRI